MKQFASALNPDEIVFVIDSSIGQACFDQASAFKKAVNVGSVIITKLDCHAKGGGALLAVSAAQIPIILIGAGENLDDFEEFHASFFIRGLLGNTENKDMQVIGGVNPDDQPKVMDNKKQGKYTMRDVMQTPFISILKLGNKT